MFRNAVEVDPAYADAHAGICDTLLERFAPTHSVKDFASAEGACQRALELDNKAAIVHIALGNLYRNSGEYETAVDAFDTAIRLNFNSPAAFVGLA